MTARFAPSIVFHFNLKKVFVRVKCSMIFFFQGFNWSDVVLSSFPAICLTLSLCIFDKMGLNKFGRRLIFLIYFFTFSHNCIFHDKSLRWAKLIELLLESQTRKPIWIMHLIFTSVLQLSCSGLSVWLTDLMNYGEALFAIDFMSRCMLRSQGSKIVIVKSNKVHVEAVTLCIINSI